MDTLLLKPECAELLEKFDKSSNEVVTCIFGDYIQFEKLDETKLLPLVLMRIVHDYCDDEMIIECSYDYRYVVFVINKKTVYKYDLTNYMLLIPRKNFEQHDDSIKIIFSSMEYFNLSRLYISYSEPDQLRQNTSKVIVNNNKYTMTCETITFGTITYIAEIRNHEILKQRIAVINQLIDIVKKNWSAQH